MIYGDTGSWKHKVADIKIDCIQLRLSICVLVWGKGTDFSARYVTGKMYDPLQVRTL